MKPYYDHAGITIYHGDARDGLPEAGVLVTDPPYGIAYRSGMTQPDRWSGAVARSIANDHDTTTRDAVLALWGERPALVFGTWKAARPKGTHTLLVWDTRGALGMGDLSVPWKPSHQEIYVLGRGFVGRRDTDVLSYPPVQAMASNGRVHPNEKPVDLLLALLGKTPSEWTVLDPFCGSGPTLRAAKDLGRRAIGIEIEERYCEIAAKRLSQEVLALG